MREEKELLIAIILCENENDKEIDLLGVDKSEKHIGQYLTYLSPKKLFQEKLHKAIQRARENFALKELE